VHFQADLKERRVTHMLKSPSGSGRRRDQLQQQGRNREKQLRSCKRTDPLAQLEVRNGELLQVLVLELADCWRKAGGAL